MRRSSFCILVAALGAAGLARAQSVTWQLVDAQRGRYVAAAIASDGSIVLGEAKVGLTASTDGGMTWSFVDKPDLIGLDFRIAADTAGTVLAGGGDAFIVGHVGRDTLVWSSGDVAWSHPTINSVAVGRDGRWYLAGADVFASDDRGLSWWRFKVLPRPVDFAWRANRIRTLLPASTGRLVAVADSGYFRSMDRGETWTKVSSRTYSASSLFCALPGGSILRIHRDSLSITRDDGATWSSPIVLSDSIASLHATHEGFVLAATARGRVLASRDSGTTWTGLPLPAGVVATSVAIGARRTLVTETGAAHVSSDDGATWSTIHRRLSQLGVTASAALSPRHVWLGTDSGGSMRYDSRVGFVPSNQGLPRASITAMLALDTVRVLVGTTAGAFASDDGGRSWSRLVALPPTTIVTAFGRGAYGRILAGTVLGTIHTSSDGGRSWRTAAEGHQPVRAFAHARDGWAYAALGSEGYRVSPDGGQEWQPPVLAPNSAHVLSVATLWRSRSVLGTRDHGAYVSDDHGETWQRASDGLSAPTVTVLAADSTGTLFAGTAGGGVYRLDPGSLRWSVQPQPIGDRYVQTLTVIPLGRLIAGTRVGALISNETLGGIAPVGEAAKE